jgi:NTE family protein
MSIPFVFAGVPINGEMHSDGGFKAALPIGPLYESGIRKIIAVGMKSSSQLKQEDYPDCKLVVIKPDKELGRFPIATFRFTERAVMEWMSLGYMDAHKTLDKHRFFD